MCLFQIFYDYIIIYIQYDMIIIFYIENEAHFCGHKDAFFYSYFLGRILG